MGSYNDGSKMINIYKKDNNILKNRLRLLQNEMTKNQIDCYFVPRVDMFSGEEVPQNEERLKYISGFSGSAGFGIVSSNPDIKSAIFSDGRYKLQIKKEINQNFFDSFEGNVKEIGIFLKKNQDKFKNIGIDPCLITVKQYFSLKNILEKTKINIKFIQSNLIDEIWYDKPILQVKDIFTLPINKTGKSRQKKIDDLAKTIDTLGGDYFILFRPTGNAWLLNIRGRDLDHTPVSRSYSVVSKQGNIKIFTNNMSFNTIFKNIPNIEIHDFNQFSHFIKSIKNKVFLIDEDVLPIIIYEDLKSNKLITKIIECPVEKAKSIKNFQELNGMKRAHLKDGLAFIKLLYWFEQNVYSKKLNEISVAKKIFEFRSLEKTFVCESFSTISGFAENGAIIHYKANEITNKTIDKDGLYLLDTGGQYLEGTTDITRTLLVGKPNNDMIEDYTLVLKGHIAISQAVFPYGTRGRELDTLARASLWLRGKDYAHGTGHGVGCFLGVHEGPISISKHTDCIIEKGMVISNEPGYYRKGKYGIRIENLEIVSKENLKNNNKKFLCFKNITRVPIETTLINQAMLTQSEINWINDYHYKVYSDLSKLISSSDIVLLDFLKLKTKKI
jgi:Xaa-Pro aminopeptidase